MCVFMNGSIGSVYHGGVQQGPPQTPMSVTLINTLLLQIDTHSYPVHLLNEL